VADPTPLIEKWEEFLGQYGYDEKIREIAGVFPEERSLFVKYTDIEHFDVEFADGLLQNPGRVIKAGEKAIESLAQMAQTIEEGAVIHLRIISLPTNLKIEIRDIRSKDMSRFFSVEGLVRKANEVRPRVSQAAFKCMRCGHIISILQEDALLREPLQCPEEGGCGRAAGSTKFKLQKEISTFIDTEKIEIQEQPEALRAGAQPQSLTGYLEDDIAGRVFPGARIIINGILDSRPRRSGTQGLTTFDIFLQANSVEFLEADAYDIQVSDEEMAQIEELASDPQIIDVIKDSISPTIFGLPYEKEALALQLFGGVPKNMPDGTRIKGDIHILLIGDPGTAKSQLLRYMADITPRGIYASGKTATGAGLTAAAVKDEWSEGRWTLEAGALVLADMGLACIDELDKMSPQDRSAMHEAMEQQTISVAKAGITATLQSRCALLGAANPKWGRFSEREYIAEQIDLPVTLLSRFDLIFPITDRPDAVEDSRIADHILKSHLVGEIRERLKSFEEVEASEAEMQKIENMDAPYKPPIDPEILRKYVFVAKKVYPIMTEEAMDALKAYYLEVRKLGEADETKKVPITARQLEAFVRVAEASARAKMKDVVTREDADRAIKIVKEYLRRVVGRGEDELAWDTDSLYTDVPHTQQERVWGVRDIMKDLIRTDVDGFTMTEVIEKAEERGISEDKVMAIWERLRKDGDIYQQSSKRDGETLFKLTHEL
jgi:replicative DNA helicase Mcm